MKVGLQHGITGFSGKLENIVYCYNRKLNKVYARPYRYPKLSPENERVGSISAHLFNLDISSAYKEDMGFYLMRYNSLRENRNNPLPNWAALYIKLMYRMAKQDPEIDLRAVTKEQIIEQDLPCRSIKRAVESGLLPQVLDWESYCNSL